MEARPHRAVAPEPPAWAVELAAEDPGRFKLIGLRLPALVAAGGSELENATRDAYLELSCRLRDGPAWHALRVWNFVPGILARCGEGLDRYMCFNAGRYQAYSEWFGGVDAFDRRVPAASAVGHDGTDLIIYALASCEPGVAVANPRQRAPHRYSRQFGPLPPCFARAVCIRHRQRELLVVGGTASVRDEQSMHPGDLPAQLDETFENLSALVSEAFRPTGHDDALAHFGALRVYHVREGDFDCIRRAVARRFSRLSRAEFFRAELCRADLLVEIEGLAAIPSPHAAARIRA